MDQIAGGLGAIFGMFLFIFLAVLAVITIMVPFFIYRIRNELIQINDRMGVLVERSVEASFKPVDK